MADLDHLDAPLQATPVGCPCGDNDGNACSLPGCPYPWPPGGPARAAHPAIADDWSELERLAKEATPGPWSTCVRMGGDAIVDAPTRPVARVDYRRDMSERDRDAAFIAAANPATILKLISAARRDDQGGLQALAQRPGDRETAEAAPLCIDCLDCGGDAGSRFNPCPTCGKARADA